jgi:hypothetical protein
MIVAAGGLIPFLKAEYSALPRGRGCRDGKKKKKMNLLIDWLRGLCHR